MYQKKSSHCQDQAINTLQNIFPSVKLAQLSKKSSVWEVLQQSAKKIPRPGLGDITSAISNMKTVVDNQQLKIQKNMLEIQKCQEIIMMSTKKSSYNLMDKQNNEETGIKLNFDFMSDDNSMEPEIPMIYEKLQLHRKNLYFGEPQKQEIDYFEQRSNQHLNDNMNDNMFDDQKDVQKYLSFDL